MPKTLKAAQKFSNNTTQTLATLTTTRTDLCMDKATTFILIMVLHEESFKIEYKD